MKLQILIGMLLNIDRCTESVSIISLHAQKRSSSSSSEHFLRTLGNLQRLWTSCGLSDQSASWFKSVYFDSLVVNSHMPDSNHRRCEQCPARPRSRRLWTLLARLSHAHAVIPPSTPAGRRGSRALRGSARKQDTVRDLLCLRLWLREKENTGVSHLLRSTTGWREVLVRDGSLLMFQLWTSFF